MRGRNWISCPLRIFFLRELRGYDGLILRSGWIIGTATILFHMIHTCRTVGCAHTVIEHIYIVDPPRVESISLR